MSNAPRQQMPLAIVGMACRLPGAASLEEFWRLAQAGGCAIGELPASRLDPELYYNPVKDARGSSYSPLSDLGQGQTLVIDGGASIHV